MFALIFLCFRTARQRGRVLRPVAIRIVRHGYLLFPAQYILVGLLSATASYIPV
ncbi:hypothetical protein BCR43DRAFT_485659 [Syncephalastrum racemosum]|uniref:Uncharacterized protein n=1 Tax=Syncephalastrum racemosum TaxID=13706 RepID=A0A1X2HN29_SYNRA|nr:hypothetical protein BCR43DRAFT_485659 [Syncephalastrum racemosum]